MIKDNFVYIQHILESITHIEEFLKDFLSKNSQIPWENIIGMRHKLIHDYFEVKLELVWDTATIDLPHLKPQLQSILK